MSGSTKRLRAPEFIALIACLMALDALAIDAMLPALGDMARDLAINSIAQRQYIVTAIFAGFALGLMAYGMLGDRYGRKPPILGGIAVYIAGSALSACAGNLPMMLIGRVLQGLGAAGPYVLSTALVRDTHEGVAMARIMSLVMMVFTALPAVAPLLGQGMLLLGSWRLIFVGFIVFALLTGSWLALRQPETLAPEHRQALEIGRILHATREVLCHPQVLRITLTQGVVFGAFAAFLSNAQPILQEHYALGVYFPWCFAILALTLGVASFGNSGWVMRLGMQRLARRALVAQALVALVFGALQILLPHGLPLAGFMLCMMALYFCCGILMGNLGSLAMTPMGHIAGMASAVIGSISTFLGLLLASLIGLFFDGTGLAIIIGFGLCALVSLGLLAFKAQEGPSPTDMATQQA